MMDDQKTEAATNILEVLGINEIEADGVYVLPVVIFVLPHEIYEELSDEVEN